MQIIVSGKEMKQLDEVTTQNFHVPGIVLMEQAAYVFVETLMRQCPVFGHVLVVCGTGNNGGDGIAIARLMRQRGVEAEVYLPKQEPASFSVSCQLQKEIYEAYGYPFVSDIMERDDWDWVVDALFGTGLSREISGEYAGIIERMNQLKAKKAAVDIPSGVSANTGEILGAAFRADMTITFSFAKIGHYIWPGSECCGKIRIADMGITKESFIGKGPKLLAYTEEELCLLPKRKQHSHKGSYGKLLVIAGSFGMAGAAYLCAKAAYRCGTGLVRILTPEENRGILQTAIPEAVVSVYQKQPAKKQLEEAAAWADVIVFGPGIGTGSGMEEALHNILLMADVPMVIDADGLNLLAKEPELLNQSRADIIVTPHLGEMARLTGKTVSEIQQNIIHTACDFAERYGVVCVLKDAHTITAVPSGEAYLNLTGNCGMATAGSGDVLSGVIGSLLGQNLTAETAAVLGVYLHGMAGDKIRAKTGTYGMMAEDIIEGLTEIWNKEAEWSKQ